jgi:hypothetical protein
MTKSLFFMVGDIAPALALLVSVPCALLTGPLVLGAVLIPGRQVGVVVKRFGAARAGPLIALNGEAGYQADTSLDCISDIGAGGIASSKCPSWLPQGELPW